MTTTTTHGRDRDSALAETFVLLADTLVDDFDLVEVHGHLVHACVDLLGSAAAGLMIADQRGRLQIVASSTDEAHVLEALEIQHDEGPCLDCFRDGHPVEDTVLDADSTRRWPSFTPRALELGFSRVQALPMRLRRTTIGALNLFGTEESAIAPDGIRVAQALADVATIALLQQRAVRDSHLLADQLQTALNERLVVEQAKGLLAERGGTSVGEAFTLLRRWARDHRVTVAALARDLVEGRQDADDVLAQRWPNEPSRG